MVSPPDKKNRAARLGDEGRSLHFGEALHSWPLIALLVTVIQICILRDGRQASNLMLQKMKQAVTS